MNGIENNKYWSKHPLWRQLKYDCEKKSLETLQNMKGILHVTKSGEWQLDYKTLDGLHQ